ncbi:MULTISPECIES: hypothetical protein [unclassified Luteimonas]|uniref:hypothetical protein n=1 Tax=unclassified Luteimonas TaxID=2629088 RepID=UPI0016005FF6|nr:MULTISPECIES: hypothetical protein [unclassified Luteimonas]MBB1472422.1 hypothetical protein [Luteimonas sp. MC1782]MBB6598866.1 hypothetical protein [Luteimonas sp. MC1825]QOC89017.1 hypothetical protein IDM46_04575 [Luteimonas sp. MC1825]
MSMRHTSKALLTTFGAVLALSACGGGADRVASPGEGAFPPPPPTAPPPPPTTPPPPPPTGGPAADCPTGFTNIGTVAEGSLRACRLPERIVGNLLVPERDGTVYAISGRVAVGDDQGGDINNEAAGAQEGVLTIEPGVTLYGSAGADLLVVNRGSQIYAQGTATKPITLTARADIEGQTNANSIGLWGGLVLLGRAPINACPGTTVSGTPECQATIEGTDGFYGGNAPRDNSGIVKYLRVKHSGFEVTPNNELNGITLGGVGDGTVFEYVQVHNSSDDGIEWFGGTVNGRYIVVTGADDDSLDTDTGWNGALQYGIVIQRATGGDRMNEWSSIRREPYSNPKVANFTYVGRAGGGAAITLNQGTQAAFYNTVVTRPAGGTGAALQCLSISDENTTGTFGSVFFSCPTPFADARAEAAFTSGTGNSVGTSTLANVFVNGANESAVAAFQGLTSVDSHFQQVDYIGGVRNAGDTWWQGWTCGLTADTSC